MAIVVMGIHHPLADASEPQKGPTFHAFMYKENAAGCPLTAFFPSDKIVVQTNFLLLEKGQYTFLVEWYNPMGKIQETSQHDFYHPEDAPYAIWSKLQLHPSGTLKRMLSATQNEGYDPEYFGTWRIKLYLNQTELMTKTFQIRS